MTGWLLDTNVLSELRRPNPDAKVMAFVRECPLDKLNISTVMLAEIRFGIERTSDTSRKVELNQWLTLKVRPMFTNRVLEMTEDIMLRWRILVEEGRVAHISLSPEHRVPHISILRCGFAGRPRPSQISGRPNLTQQLRMPLQHL